MAKKEKKKKFESDGWFDDNTDTYSDYYPSDVLNSDDGLTISMDDNTTQSESQFLPHPEGEETGSIAGETKVIKVLFEVDQMEPFLQEKPTDLSSVTIPTPDIASIIPINGPDINGLLKSEKIELVDRESADNILYEGDQAKRILQTKPTDLGDLFIVPDIAPYVTVGVQKEEMGRQLLINAEDGINSNWGNKEAFAYYRVCDMLRRYDLKRIKEEIFKYDFSRGVFMRLDINALKTLIRVGVSDETNWRLNKNEIADIVERLQTEPSIEVDDCFDINEDLVCFKNGVLDISTGKLSEHSANYMITTSLDASYISNYTLAGTKFKNFLLDISDGSTEKQNHMQEILGYLLSSNSRLKKAVVFNGVKHSGKSTLLRLLIKIIGKSNVSNFSMKDLNKRFTTGKLLTKKLNIFGEHSSIVQNDIEVFKAITGRDWLETENKSKDFQGYLAKTKLLFAGNSLPLFVETEDMHSFLDRVTLFLFSNSIPEKKRILDFDDILFFGRDAIVSWAMDGLIRLKNNNFIFTEAPDAVILRQSKMTQIGPIEGFLDDYCEVNEFLRVYSTDLYSQYKQYCRDNLFEELSKSVFITRIIALTEGLGVQHKKIRIKNDVPLMGFTGMGIKKGTAQINGTTEQHEENAEE